ncbi:MAG: uracil-DNA glycosylase [Spirochaetes bacterium]|nr:uracil-DNA glycosylase [Spirochaetota bacterium]
MTADEKLKLARFLDTTSDFLSTGYKQGDRDYHFEDSDPVASHDAQATADLKPAGLQAEDSLEAISLQVKNCAACSLGEGRKNAVPGEGVPQPLVMIIGEGPGADEDAGGRPFVGKAGQLLDKMLGSIGLFRESNCFIANVVKCRPPGNRDPEPDEVAACSPFLRRQIKLLKPRYILCVGRVAARCLLNADGSLASFRGKLHELIIEDTAFPLLVTYHPSALLRDEELKRPAWEDLKTLRAKLEDEGGLTP